MPLYITPRDNGGCITHDGYIQVGIFKHSVEEHKKLNPTIEWLDSYWVPDKFTDRYPRVTWQKTEKANEGSPKTDNADDCRPRDFPCEDTVCKIPE